MKRKNSNPPPSCNQPKKPRHDPGLIRLLESLKDIRPITNITEAKVNPEQEHFLPRLLLEVFDVSTKGNLSLIPQQLDHHHSPINQQQQQQQQQPEDCYLLLLPPEIIELIVNSMIAPAIREPCLVSVIRLSGVSSRFRGILLGLGQNPRSLLHGYLKQLCHDLSQIKVDPTVFPHLPQQYPEVGTSVIKRNHHYLKFMRHPTYDMCNLAVSTPPCDPNDLPIIDFYEYTTFGYSAVLKRVPLEHRTPELCLVAVKSDPTALEFVPDDLKTPELCALAVQLSYSSPPMTNFNPLQWVPVDLRTPDLCWIAVRANIEAFSHVPPAAQTPELCSFVVERNGEAYHDVRDDLKNDHLRILALKTYSELLTVLPSEELTHDLLFAVLKQNPLHLKLIREEDQTKDLCWVALEGDPTVLRFIKPKPTLDQCLFAVEKNPKSAFLYVPQDCQTPEVCRIAISACYENIHLVAEPTLGMISPLLTPEFLKWVAGKVICHTHTLMAWPRLVFHALIVTGTNPPKNFIQSTAHVFKIDPWLRRLAVETDPIKWLKHVAPHCTDEDFGVAIQKNGLALQFLYLTKQYTPALCMLAVQQNGLALQYVPQARKTRKMCQAAVQQNALALQYVPAQWKQSLDI